jgi:phage baseplate assembly protein W
MAALTPDKLVGRGVVQPLVRDEKTDYANEEGVRLVLSNVRQVLGTQVGEVRWRRQFGSRLHLLRHRPNHPSLRGVAEAFVAQALRWERRARLRRVEHVPGAPNALTLRVYVDVVLDEAVVVPAQSVDVLV